MSGARDLLAGEALKWVPKILTLQDRNRHSPTYGCFDRNYWQYKIIDFPTGMSQEFVYPLALAWDCDAAGNAFYRRDALREWAEAGIVFSARSAHRDGSCDDYFPFEKAGGAAAFSLLACVEAARILDIQNYEALKFFERRADWLAGHHESGRLANHQALIVLGLSRAGRLLGTDKWERALDARLEKLLSWQNEEGWFQEYEGCDPGYHTLTVSLLAQIYDEHPDPALRVALSRAVALAAQFIHPDGSFGGECGSRNTYNFFPHGFEVFGKHEPSALAVNDRFLDGLAAGLGPCYADDHIVGHHTWNYLLAWRDFCPDRPPADSSGGAPDRAEAAISDAAPGDADAAPAIDLLAPDASGRVHLRNAGIAVDRRGGAALYVALNKGGAFKLFRGGKLVASDTGVSLLVADGSKLRNAVSHLVGDYSPELAPDRIKVRGSMGWAKQKKMTPFNLIALRLLMLCGGRLFPDLVRKLLQKVLITGKKSAPFRFEREFEWSPDGALRVRDRVEADSWLGVKSAALGVDQTSIYVVMSRTFQPGQMLPWTDLTDAVARLQPGDPLEHERVL